MARSLTVPDELWCKTLIAAESVTLPDSQIENKHIQPGAGISAMKVQHQHRPGYAQKSDTSASNELRVVWIARAAGTIVGFEATCVVANIGDSTVEFDLLINGATALTAPISMDSGDLAYAVVAGILSTTAIADGDVLETQINATVGTGTLGKGAAAFVTINEAPE